MTLPLCTRVRCRQIERTDLDAIANLLVRGFPATVKSYWVNALKTLDNHPAPEDAFVEYASILLLRGDVAAYRQWCDRLAERFGRASSSSSNARGPTITAPQW